MASVYYIKIECIFLTIDPYNQYRQDIGVLHLHLVIHLFLPIHTDATQKGLHDNNFYEHRP